MGRNDLSLQAGPGRDLVVNPKAAENAAVRSIKAACISLGGAAAGLWLATLLGNIVLLLIGLLVWLAVWPFGVGYAIGALRNSWSSPTPGIVRGKAWIGVGISVFSLVLVVAYIIALSVAVNKLT